MLQQLRSEAAAKAQGNLLQQLKSDALRQLAEQAKRYDEMAGHMKIRVLCQAGRAGGRYNEMAEHNLARYWRHCMGIRRNQ